MAPRQNTGEHFPHEHDVHHGLAEVTDITGHIRQIGAHAIESGNVPAAELPKNPEVADVQDIESERKKNTAENLRVLQKRFGERFVKGNLMEGGGYTDGAARELMAGFMDQAGFAAELKRIIPNKHGALQLLKDNYAYIQATLEKFYQDGPTHEKQPAKDPYELARSVGYELTGPFASTSEFVPYDKQDFRSGERLCTFNDPAGRLGSYHIFWLRHTEVKGTLPADKLTADNLSDAWKTYLKTIGRYDADLDRYDLTDLRPSRDDPYGTSSMSVQISREGAHVSVKNRYNHTVGNPDNTLDSDLDNVAYGLKRAVYTRVGRKDLMDKTSVVLAEGYIADNDGGIHAYKYEENNVYYSDYEYVSNGVVTAIDRGKYYMVSPQLYVPRSGKGDQINLRPDSTGLAAGSDVKFVHRASSKNDEKDPHVAELRQARAESDRAELTQLLHESLKEQARAAYDAYQYTAQQLYGEMMPEATFLELLERKRAEWQADGTVDYLVSELIEHGSTPNLIATPNVLANWKELRGMAKRFGERQPYETYIYDGLYKKYSPGELSGALTDGPLRFSLIPSRYTERLGSNTADRQLEILAQMQSENPDLHLRVPSVLDAIVYWQTLRSRGDALADRTTFDKTYIGHFDLPAKQLDGWLRVPRSCVYDDGVPNLDASSTDFDCVVRVAVG